MPGIRRPGRGPYPPASRAEILSAHVGAGEADRDPLPPRDLELDRGPIARRASAIDAAATNSFARLVIGVIIETFDETASVGRDCRFPFGAAPERSKEHDQRLLKQDEHNMNSYREQSKYKLQKRARFQRDRQKLFATAIRLELGYEF